MRRSLAPPSRFPDPLFLAVFVLAAFVLFWQIRLNKKKDAGEYDNKLEGKSAEEIENLGAEHPGFRYRH